MSYSLLSQACNENVGDFADLKNTKRRGTYGDIVEVSKESFETDMSP